jgi:hypothetical protein
MPAKDKSAELQSHWINLTSKSYFLHMNGMPPCSIGKDIDDPYVFSMFVG